MEDCWGCKGFYKVSAIPVWGIHLHGVRRCKMESESASKYVGWLQMTQESFLRADNSLHRPQYCSKVPRTSYQILKLKNLCSLFLELLVFLLDQHSPMLGLCYGTFQLVCVSLSILSEFLSQDLIASRDLWRNPFLDSALWASIWAIWQSLSWVIKGHIKQSGAQCSDPDVQYTTFSKTRRQKHLCATRRVFISSCAFVSPWHFLPFCVIVGFLEPYLTCMSIHIRPLSFMVTCEIQELLDLELITVS